MKSALSEIAATSWREWLSLIAEFVAVAVIVCSIGLFAIGFSPDINMQ